MVKEGLNGASAATACRYDPGRRPPAAGRPAGPRPDAGRGQATADHRIWCGPAVVARRRVPPPIRTMTGSDGSGPTARSQSSILPGGARPSALRSDEAVGRCGRLRKPRSPLTPGPCRRSRPELDQGARGGDVVLLRNGDHTSGAQYTGALLSCQDTTLGRNMAEPPWRRHQATVVVQ